MRSVLLFGILRRIIFVWFHYRRLVPCICALFLIFTGLHGQQCTLPSNIFLPTADEVKYDLLGMTIDVDGEYMVAGAQENSNFQTYSGRALVYKLGADNQWERIAELTPSDPAKYLNFGSKVAIHGNSIVIKGREYNDDGIGREKLYVFEKGSGEEWASSTEDYVITKPFGSPLNQGWYGAFDLRGNELIALSLYEGKWSIEIFNKSAGVFSLSQTIDAPLSDGGYAVHEWNLALGEDFIVIGSEQIQNTDLSNGAVFVYEKNGSYNETPAVLKSAVQSASEWQGFGIAIAVSNNTLFVQGLRRVGDNYNRSFYVFEKPSGGWTDATQPIMLESPGYVFSYPQLVANENYFFSTGENFASIEGFKSQ